MVDCVYGQLPTSYLQNVIDQSLTVHAVYTNAQKPVVSVEPSENEFAENTDEIQFRRRDSNPGKRNQNPLSYH